MSESLGYFLNIQKTYQKIRFNFFERTVHLLIYHERPERIAHGCSFVTHEQPEQFAHSRSFDMSDLSDLLTVAHLS